MEKHVLSLSYGKDSLSCLGAIEKLGWPLDRIIHAEVWATDTIPADLPAMVEFKDKADQIIKERWGLAVERITSGCTFETGFYSKVGGRAKPEYRGGIRGWPIRCGQWCLRDLKLPAMRKIGGIQYIGIAADEPARFHDLDDTHKSPIKEAKWTEADCRKWCEENNLLSPIYTTEARGGCWFCHNQGAKQLRTLRKNHPEYWSLMLEWDADSPVTFHADGHTVHDFEQRFALEDEGLISADDRVFRWSMLEDELNYRWF